MHIELQDILRLLSVICIFFLQVGINFLIGYLIAFVIFAAVIPRQFCRRTSVLNVIREAYSIRALKSLFAQVRLLRSWKNEVGTWTFFTIGARQLLSFSERDPGPFFCALGLTVIASLFLVLQWKRDFRGKVAFDPIDNLKKNAEQGADGDAEEAV
jgi:hypothetical protein